jgi:hypothetical protein
MMGWLENEGCLLQRRLAMFYQGVDERLLCLAQAEAILLVHVTGIELSLFDVMVHTAYYIFMGLVERMLVFWSSVQCAGLIQCFIMADLFWIIEMDNPGLSQTTRLSNVDLTTHLQGMDALLP